MRNIINISDVRGKKCEAYDDTKERDKSHKSTNSEMTESYENNAKFLRMIEHIIKVEVQQHHDNLMKRIDQKLAGFWLAFENFKHNFHLDRDYRQHNYVEINSDDTGSNVMEGLCGSTCDETVRSYLNTESEERDVQCEAEVYELHPENYIARS